MYDEARHTFAIQLHQSLKPERFWVTDFLAQRLMDIELTFASGDVANTETVVRCAEYAVEILQLDSAKKEDVAASIESAQVSAELKSRLHNLIRMAAQLGDKQATSEQAYEAVRSFMELVFRRDER